jgi:hypothetical protein
MSEFSEILDLSDFESDKPVAIDKSEKTFLEQFVKGSSVEMAADYAGITYIYAFQLLQHPDVIRFLKIQKEKVKNVPEIQKREALGTLAEMSRTRPLEFITEGGEWDIAKLKEANVPVKSMEVKKDKEGRITGHKVIFYDINEAYKLMSNVHGWNAPTEVKHSGYIGGLTPEVLERMDAIDAELVEEPEAKDPDEDAELLKRLLS